MKRPLGLVGLWLAFSMAANAAEPWTLERALDYALTHNPDARIAQQRIAAAQAGLEQANSTFWPRLQVQSGYTRTDNPMMAFGSILNQRSYSSSLNFNDVPGMDDLNAKGMITVPLYAGGRNVAGRQAAKATTEAAKQDSAAIRNELGFEVSRAFHTVLKTRQFILAAEAAVNSFETNLVVAETASGWRHAVEVRRVGHRGAPGPGARRPRQRPQRKHPGGTRACAICWASKKASSLWPTLRQSSVRRTPEIFRNARNLPLPASAKARHKRRSAGQRAAICLASAPLAAWITITAR